MPNFHEQSNSLTDRFLYQLPEHREDVTARPTVYSQNMYYVGATRLVVPNGI